MSGRFRTDLSPARRCILHGLAVWGDSLTHSGICYNARESLQVVYHWGAWKRVRHCIFIRYAPERQPGAADSAASGERSGGEPSKSPNT